MIDRREVRAALSAFRGTDIAEASEMEFDVIGAGRLVHPFKPTPRRHFLTKEELKLIGPSLLTEHSASLGISSIPRLATQEAAAQKVLEIASPKPREELLEGYFASKVFSDALAERNRLVAQGVDIDLVNKSFAGRIFEDLAFRDLAGQVTTLYPGTVLLSPERSDALTFNLMPFLTRSRREFGRRSFRGVEGYSPDGFVVSPKGMIMAVVEYSMSQDPSKFAGQYNTFKQLKDGAPAALGKTDFLIVVPAETNVSLIDNNARRPDMKTFQSLVKRRDVGRNLSIAAAAGQKAVVEALVEERPEKQAVNRAVSAALRGNPTDEDIRQIFLHLDQFTRPITVTSRSRVGVFAMQKPRSR